MNDEELKQPMSLCQCCLEVKGHQIIFIVSLTILFAAAWAICRTSPRDALYKDRKFTAILDETIKKYNNEGQAPDAWKELQRAVKVLGPKAVPLVLKKVRNSNSRVLTAYQKFRQEAAPGIRSFLPACDVPVLESYRAGQLITLVGDAAVPWLIKGLNDHCMEVRLTCVRTLDGMCDEHPEKRKEFLPLFISATHDATAEVRMFGISSMRNLGADAKPAIPTLLWALSSSQAGQKKNPMWHMDGLALMILGSIGKEARETLPIIKSRLNDTNSFDSLQAAVAVWRIDHDFQTVFPVLTNLLPTFDKESGGQIFVFDTFGEMGTNAASAVPMIKASLQSEVKPIARAASNALVKIIPEQAIHLIQKEWR
jgi:hypothetical protein